MSRFAALLVGAAALALVAQAGAGTVASPDSAARREAEKRPRASAWRAVPEAGATFTFDDNAFLLADRKKDNLDPVAADDRASARYADMESASDLVTEFEAAVALRGDGIGGRRLTITPEARYALHASNPRRSHARVGLTLEQDLPKDGRLRLRDRWTPEYFSRNYLADAVDLDGSDTITPEERRYRTGAYTENEAQLDWRFRLAKASKAHPLGASLELGAGHYLRTYDEPFGNRDLAGPTAAATLDVEFSRRTALEVEYDLAALSADPGAEVLLLDEGDFGVDFNGDGNVGDNNVRVVTRVDYSRTDHEFGATLRHETSPKTRLSLSYSLRRRAYGSDEPLDIAHRDRRDTRHAFGAELRIALDRAVDLTLGAEAARQSTNRGGDPGATGDEDDYGRRAAYAAITWRR